MALGSGRRSRAFVCSDYGEGHIADNKSILKAVHTALKIQIIAFLIASGPTREFDPVVTFRIITGNDGRYLVQAGEKEAPRGLGECPEKRRRRGVGSGTETAFAKNDVLVMAARFRCETPVFQDQNKKKGPKLDRLDAESRYSRGLSRKKKKSQIFVGFALESKIFRKCA